MNASDSKYDNDWYFWGLENIGGSQGGMYQSFAYATRTTEMSARTYISWLKSVILMGDNGKPWETNNRKDAVKTMEKWLVLWDEKRAIEIPIELEAKRIEDIRIAEEKRLQDIEDARVEKENRIKKLESDRLLLHEIRTNSNYKVEESRYLELLQQDYDDLVNYGEGYHHMPDGSVMKDSDMKNITTGISGIAGFAIIGLLLYSKGGLK